MCSKAKELFKADYRLFRELENNSSFSGNSGATRQKLLDILSELRNKFWFMQGEDPLNESFATSEFRRYHAEWKKEVRQKELFQTGAPGSSKAGVFDALDLS